MKMLLLLSTFLVAGSCFASTPQQKIREAFARSPLVAQEMKKWSARPNGQIQLTRIAGMGDGCELMESYLVTQQISTTETFYTSVVAARVEVEIFDLACQGRKTPGKRIYVELKKIVDLNAATR